MKKQIFQGVINKFTKSSMSMNQEIAFEKVYIEEKSVIFRKNL